LDDSRSERAELLATLDVEVEGTGIFGAQEAPR
jgi:hypothetical protein